jgi:hypothetical protein
MKFIAIVMTIVACGMVANSRIANAQTVTNNMTCQQAIAAYEKNGRVNIRQRSGTVLPIYNGTPLSQKNKLRCSSKSPTMVPTKDKPRCAVAYVCNPHSGGGR